jgi:hypothetical protein
VLIAAMMKDNEDLVKEEAIEWASRCPAADGDVLEIRQVFEAADVGSRGRAPGGRAPRSARRA